MKKVFLIAVFLLVTVSYGQNYNYPVGLYNYNALQSYNRTAEYKLAKAQAEKEAEYKLADKKVSEEITSKELMADSEASRYNVVVRKAPTEVLVRYNGDFESLRLYDLSGKEVEANFSKKYRGLIIPRGKESKDYYLEVIDTTGTSKTFYHKVSL